jgi:hypothetical protein
LQSSMAWTSAIIHISSLDSSGTVYVISVISSAYLTQSAIGETSEPCCMSAPIVNQKELSRLYCIHRLRHAIYGKRHKKLTAAVVKIVSSPKVAASCNFLCAFLCDSVLYR